MSYVVVFLSPVSAGERWLFAFLILWELLTLLRQCCILCFSFLFKLSFHQFVVKILKREHDFRVIYSINSIITFRTNIQVYTNLGVKLIAFATDRLQGITSVFERRCYRKLTTFPKVNIGAIQTTSRRLIINDIIYIIYFGAYSHSK